MLSHPPPAIEMSSFCQARSKLMLETTSCVVTTVLEVALAAVVAVVGLGTVMAWVKLAFAPGVETQIHLPSAPFKTTLPSQTPRQPVPASQVSHAYGGTAGDPPANPGGGMFNR